MLKIALKVLNSPWSKAGLAVLLMLGLVWRIWTLGGAAAEARMKIQQLEAQQAALVAQAARERRAIELWGVGQREAARKAEGELVRFRNAIQRDPETLSWMANCGAAPVPCRVREYALGYLPAECAPGTPN